MPAESAEELTLVDRGKAVTFDMRAIIKSAEQLRRKYWRSTFTFRQQWSPDKAPVQ